jgi:hypothetical protein
MEKTTVDLRMLSNSQKTEFLKHIRVFLQQRVDEERYYRSFSLSSLEEDNVGLEFDLTAEMSAPKNAIEKIKKLKTEQKILLLEIDELKKTAEAKSTVLESEVNALRDEVKALKILMNASERALS